MADINNVGHKFSPEQTKALFSALCRDRENEYAKAEHASRETTVPTTRDSPETVPDAPTRTDYVANEQVFTHGVDFAMYGTASQIQAANPVAVMPDCVKGNPPTILWKEKYESKRDRDSASPYRACYAAPDVCQNGLLDMCSASDRRSALVPEKIVLTNAQNNTPNFVGLFLENIPVGRKIENPLFSKTIQDIKDAYATKHGGEGCLELVAILSPGGKQNIPCIVYDASETRYDDGDLSLSKNNYRDWLGIKMSDLKDQVSCIYQDDKCNPELAKFIKCHRLVESSKLLSTIILQNWDALHDALGMERMERPKPTSVGVSLLYSYSDMTKLGIDKNTQLSRYILNHNIVRLALENAGRLIDSLPFTNPTGHRVIAVPLDQDAWGKPTCDIDENTEMFLTARFNITFDPVSAKPLDC